MGMTGKNYEERSKKIGLTTLVERRQGGGVT